ncbi:DUF58 domain-containing protein [Wohlfahrtiimonas larvae]|uniref:DUF58 domain-containing protein n=1 Tax=Wohlfahrtiimonas larvae TaxID=1157986 RepID=A0ABP9MII4_9GAMM|nr:DUF58 domain-containing protein [Wohlfahrtiimonas larvae]
MFNFKSFKERINQRIPRNSQVTLNRKQIFIFPTKFGFIYIGMCFVLFIMAMNFENSLVYIMLFWLVSIFVSTMILTWRNLDGLRLRNAGSEPIFASDEATFNITIESLGRAHHSLWLSSKYSNNFVDCQAKASSTTYLFVSETQRGRVRLPRFIVETTYPLGIFRAWSYVDLDQTTLCYPRPLASELQYYSSVDLEDSDYLDSGVSKNRGVDNFDELKNYELGDAVSRIDWKAYAKGHGLLVKTFTEQASKEIWLSEQDFTGNLETRLSQMCYWVLEFSKNNQRFGIILGNDIKIEPNSSDIHTKKCLEALALYRTLND